MTKLRQQEAIDAMAARWVTRADAGLSAAEHTEFERWQSADPRHGAAVRHFTATWSRLDRPCSAGAVLLELGRRKTGRRRLGAAAAVAIAAGGMLFVSAPRRDFEPPMMAAQPGGVRIAPETRVLPDGSRIELKRGAEIEVDFTAALRRVALLRGEAHFQVTRDEARPFAVEADGVRVRAVGTAFSVQRGAEEIEVVVTEGRVSVEKPSRPPATVVEAGQVPDPAGVPAQTLAFADAGQRVVVPARTETPTPSVLTVTPDEMDTLLAWRAPRVEFSDTPLAEAIAMMNQSAETGSGLRLTIDSSAGSVAREPVSGIFRADNSETFVRMLELSLGLQPERRGDQIILRKGN